MDLVAALATITRLAAAQTEARENDQPCRISDTQIADAIDRAWDAGASVAQVEHAVRFGSDWDYAAEVLAVHAEAVASDWRYAAEFA